VLCLTAVGAAAFFLKTHRAYIVKSLEFLCTKKNLNKSPLIAVFMNNSYPYTYTRTLTVRQNDRVRRRERVREYVYVQL